MRQAGACSIGLGMPDLRTALVPGHVGTQSKDDLRTNILEVTLDQVVANLTTGTSVDGAVAEPRQKEIVFRGGFKAVNRWFYENELGDGLPIVPPTPEAVAAFLKHVDRNADEVLGVVLPDNRSATIWSVAVNGVMAGCRPEYMPILVALVEAMCDPAYGVEHSGNTPGADTLVIINGPIIKQLGFNYEQGALRDGFMPNTSIGRFWRLALRNIAGFLPRKNDKATFGNTWRVVLAENEDALAEVGWPTFSVDQGYAPGEDTVTIARYSGGGSFSSVSGTTPEQMMPYVADSVQKYHTWQLLFTTSQGNGALRPLVVITPIIAQTLAKCGWTKADMRRYLFEHARLPAWQFERCLRDWNIRGVWNLTEEVAAGRMPKIFHESDDPDRMVPLVWKPEDYQIVVSGDPLRNNMYVFAHNGFLGFPTTKKIRVPKLWMELLANPEP
jgi:hypothetical protein